MQFAISVGRSITIASTDYKNLMYFRKAQRLSDRQAQWALFLSEFDINLQHLPGHKLILSDALSWWPDHCPNDDEAEEQVVLPNDMFLNLLDIRLQEQIMDAKDFDFDVKMQSQSYLKMDQVWSEMTWNTGGWRTMTGRRFYSTKEKYMCLRTRPLTWYFEAISWPQNYWPSRGIENL